MRSYSDTYNANDEVKTLELMELAWIEHVDDFLSHVNQIALAMPLPLSDVTILKLKKETYMRICICSSHGGLCRVLWVQCPRFLLSAVVVEKSWHEDGIQRIANPIVELLGGDRV